MMITHTYFYQFILESELVSNYTNIHIFVLKIHRLDDLKFIYFIIKWHNRILQYCQVLVDTC